MAKVKRSAAFVMAVITLLCICACKGRPSGDTGDPTQSPAEAVSTELTEAQRERVLVLAAAFRRFGEYDLTEGLTLTRIEEMVNCMYCSMLGESEVEGYGRVTKDEADSMLKSVFGSDTIELGLRTKYDASKDQEFYFMNDYYYIRRIEEDHEYKIASTAPVTDDNGEVIGVRVLVEAFKDGKGDVTIALEVANNSAGELCVKRCVLYDWA